MTNAPAFDARPKGVTLAGKNSALLETLIQRDRMVCITKSIEESDDVVVLAPVVTSKVLTNLTTAGRAYARKMWRRKKYPAECRRIDLLAKDTQHKPARRSVAANATIAAEGGAE